MKLNLLFVLVLLIGSTTFFSCDEVKKKTQDAADATTDMIEEAMPTEPSVRIPATQAIAEVKKYNQIYGGDDLGPGVYRYLNADDGLNIPRFYTINKTDCQNILNEHLTQKKFYASMGAGSALEFGGDKDIMLIFHSIRPYSTGYLKNGGDGDSFFGNPKPCPTDCLPDWGDNPGGTISMTDANKAISIFNNKYGQGTQYMVYYNGSNNSNEGDASKGKVSIPRYFTVNRADLQGALNSANGDYVYVSLAAKEPADNVYTIDLLFHDTNPGEQGSVGAAEDIFDDFTLPCPKECGDTSNISTISDQ